MQRSTALRAPYLARLIRTALGRDHCRDAATAQPPPDLRDAVRLAARDRVGASTPANTGARRCIHKSLEALGLVGLPRRHQRAQRRPDAVGYKMKLRAKSLRGIVPGRGRRARRACFFRGS